MAKIALIGPLPPWKGGIAHHTSQLLKSLEASHEVLAISFAAMYPAWLYPGQAPNLPQDSGEHLPPARFLIRGDAPRTWRQAVEAISKFQAQAVVIPWWTVFWSPFCLYTAWALKRRGIPTLFLCHNITDHDSRWWKRQLARWTLARGSGFLTHTDQDRCQLIDFLPSAAVTVYPHPCYQQFPVADRVPRRSAKLELLFFGYVRPYKGIDLLIDALALLPNLDFHLCIAGELWIDPNRLEQRMKRIGIRDRVTLIPRYVDDQETAGLMTAADAVILPYRKASGSGVAALALHYNTPVVATRVGGLAESVVEAETGYLVPPDDPQALAAGIARLLEPRDWTALIEAHKNTATWGGLAGAVTQSIAAMRNK